MSAEQGLFVPLILGIIEGLTEFLPVSSTGHLLLVGYFFGFEQPAAFIVLIQLGAILAVITVYFARLAALIGDALAGKAQAWHFVLAVVLACLPAVIVGVAAHDFIQEVIYRTPLIICLSLLIGGVVLLLVDRMPHTIRHDDIYAFPWPLALVVGIFQMLSLIPGVSRSGASVVGAMLMGASKRAAAEFTFFIALPIMTGAFAYDFYKSRHLIASGLGLDIAIGFAAAFIAGTLVVKYLLAFVSQHGFAPFAWWRILVGGGGLIVLLLR